MDAKKLTVVPIYWGSKWLPPEDPRMRKLTFTWHDINAAMWTIMRSWYMLGLAEYGVAPGEVHPGYVITDAEAPAPATFDDNQCWTKINDTISAGHVPPKSAWDDTHKVMHALFLEPGSAFTDPNVFGKNNKSAVQVWVTANSDLAGAIETYAHEMVECSAGKEIADPCQPNTEVIDGLRLPTYRSEQLNSCWPTHEAVLLHRGFVPFHRFGELKDNPILVGAGPQP